MEDERRKLRMLYDDQVQKNDKALTTIRQFHVNDRFEINRDDATYHLALESEIPIESVLLQCDVVLDILDVEKNSAVMSFSDCDPKVMQYDSWLECFVSIEIF